MSLAIDWFRSKKGEDPMIYLDDVFRYAASRIGRREEAEDIAIEVVQSLPNPCSRQNLRIYMLGMARRKLADRMRKSRNESELRESDLVGQFDERSDESTMVGIAMNVLSQDHREVLTLKYMIGLSSVEIGRLVGKNPAAVDSLLQRARTAFESSWHELTSDEVKR